MIISFGQFQADNKAGNAVEPRSAEEDAPGPDFAIMRRSAEVAIM